MSLRRFYLPLTGVVFMVASLLPGATLPAQPSPAPLPAREIKGGISLGGDRLLVWEQVADGQGTMALWEYADGQRPTSSGTLAGEEVRAAHGVGVTVFVVDRALLVTSTEPGASPKAVELPGEWASVVFGPSGFIAGGWGDALAISKDGRTWTQAEFNAPGEGDITQLIWNGTDFLALRQTSMERDGWGIQISELCLSRDGRAWRRVTSFEGGNQYAPIDSIRWTGDRWIGHGVGALVELTPDGQSRRIVPTSAAGEEALASGNVAVFRDGSRWLLTSSAGVAESKDLAEWTPLPRLHGDGLKGVWLEGRDGAPRFVGATQRDWSQSRVFALAALLEPSTAPGASGPGAAPAVLTSAAPARVPDTVYDWPAIMAAAVKRAAAEPDYVPTESTLRLRGTKTSKWSKGSPWTAEDMIAGLKKGATAAEVVQVMKSDYDGANLDQPGILTVLTSKEWNDALAKTNSLFDTGSYVLQAEVWGLVYPRSKLADALAREVIARRQQDVPPVSKPVDSPELRRRAAAGEAEASYLLYLLYYTAGDAEGRSPIPKDLPSAEQLKAQAVAGHAAAQWLRASEFENNVDKTKNDPVRVFELHWTSAMAGDAIGAFKLAKLFAAPNDEYGVARNYAESEYWFIEAAVRGWPGQMDQPYQRPWLELANLYSAKAPNDVLATMMPTFEDFTARWLRLMKSRGGVMAEYATLAATYFELESRGNSSPFNYAQRVASMPPELPVLTEREWREIEAGAAGHGPDLLRVAQAYAEGRLVRQNDMKAVAFYRQAAEAGAGLPAYQALARHYRRGLGVNRDPVQVLAWMTKAAETNDLPSLVALADAQHFVNSDGIPQNYAAAIATYEKAVGLGDARSLYNLGMMHRYGRGVPKDEKKWREFMERAAERGYVEAMNSIAYSYIANEIAWDQKDHVQAAAWYQKAVDAGGKTSRQALAESWLHVGRKEEALALFRLLAGENGTDFVVRYHLAEEAAMSGQRDEAAKWFREVARIKASLEFMKTRASDYVREYDEEEAAKPGTLPYYRKKAKTGTADDKVEFALRVASSNRSSAEGWLDSAANEGHAFATAVVYEWQAQRDKAYAEKRIRELADKGNSQAVLIVGLLTAATDKAAGLALVRKAAEAGNADATFRLGMMQYNGNELPQDRAAGIAAITSAADAGLPLAQLTLGRALLGGDVGLTADPVRGVAWLKKVLDQQRFVPAVAAQAAVTLGQFYERSATAPAATGPANAKGVANAPASGSSGGNRVVVEDMREALKYYRLALQLGGANPQLSNHIQQLERSLAMSVKG